MASPTFTRLLRFSIVGVCVALIYYVLFLLLRMVETPRMIASTVAFGVAVTVRYFAQTSWTFGARPSNRRHATRFLIMVTTGAILSAAITALIGPALNAPDYLSALVVVVVLPVFNYLVMSIWVYRDHDAKRIVPTENKL
jgi:putative flippase GtrA